MMTDYRERKADVLAALRGLVDLAEAAGAHSLAAGLLAGRIERLEQDVFHLLVLGEFNHGKTTFVNALLGEAALPVGATPTTAVVHRIVHGEPGACIVTAAGDERPLAMDELEAFVEGGERAGDEIECLRISHPAAILEDDVVLIDTPGVNDLNHQRAEITYGAIPRADAIVFLLDAGQILKESERSFIAGKLLSGVRDRLLFVVNKVDVLSEEERIEAITYARNHLAQLVDKPRVHPLSARQALAGDMEGSGMAALLVEIRRYLTDERGRLLIDSAIEHGLGIAQMLRTGIDVKKQALRMDHEQLEARLADLEEDLDGSRERRAERERATREDLAALKATTRRDLEAATQRLLRALPEQIEGARADDLRRFLPGFIEERLRDMAEHQAQDVAEQLEAVAERVIAFVADDARERVARLSKALGPAAAGLDLKVDTFAYDVSVFALGAFGLTIMALSNLLVGGALTLAAPVLAYLFRGRADRLVKERAMEEAPRIVREAAGKLITAFDEQVDAFGDKLIDYLTQASDEMARSLAEVLRAARDAQARGEQSVAELEADTGTLTARLAALGERLKGLRASLSA